MSNKSFAKIVLVFYSYIAIIYGKKETFMKFGVISDTHCKAPTKDLEDVVAAYFTDVETVLHAGDVVTAAVLEIFGNRTVYAVQGNMDKEDLRSSLPAKRVIDCQGVRIGLMHGWGGPRGLEDKLIAEFDDIDCLVYGHTHKPVNYMRGGILIFNPGSPTDRWFAPYHSVGMLTIEEGTIRGEIIRIDEN